METGQPANRATLFFPMGFIETTSPIGIRGFLIPRVENAMESLSAEKTILLIIQKTLAITIYFAG